MIFLRVDEKKKKQQIIIMLLPHTKRLEFVKYYFPCNVDTFLVGLAEYLSCFFFLGTNIRDAGKPNIDTDPLCVCVRESKLKL